MANRDEKKRMKKKKEREKKVKQKLARRREQLREEKEKDADFEFLTQSAEDVSPEPFRYSKEDKEKHKRSKEIKKQLKRNMQILKELEQKMLEEERAKGVEKTDAELKAEFHKTLTEAAKKERSLNDPTQMLRIIDDNYNKGVKTGENTVEEYMLRYKARLYEDK